MCEVDLSMPCVWSSIWGNAENLDLTDTLMEIRPPQDWSTSRSGGLRRTVVRDDLHQPSAISAKDTKESDIVEDSPKRESPEDAFLREIGLI
jgi:hypothetical protein